MSEKMVPDSENHNYTQRDPSELKYIQFALIIFVVSILFFLTTLTGMTNGLSNRINAALIKMLGYRNKWSTALGPDWFGFLNSDISSLAGPVFLPIFIFLISFYAYLKHRMRETRKFLFVVVGGGIFMMMTKVIFATDISNQSLDIVYNTISPYPSGHAMLGTIVYITLAVVISRTQRRKEVKKFLIISAIVIAILIGISRFITGDHSVTEVIAGWSLGMFWLSTCWMLEKFTSKKGW